MGLRKVVGARIEKSGWLFPTWRFFFAKTEYFELSNRAYRLAERETLAEIGIRDGRVFWWTNSGFFWADADLSAEEVGLLVWDRERKHTAKIDRLRRIRAREEEAVEARRRAIPSEVRAFVWRRDDGRCVQCGAEDDLQFDHLIPVAKGGGNAIDNVQVLCRDCNRSKSDAIT